MDSLLDDISDAFSGFSWENALEVTVITFAIYSVLRLLRGTTAMSVVRGITIIAVAVVLLSRALDSVVLDWIVNNALAVLVLFVLIVFQPEFRRALERVGRAGGVRSWFFARREDYSTLVPLIAETAERLSARRVGALIVLERDTGLQDVVDSGVPVEAKPSVDLLESIFFPNSPLHDGAVIVRPGMVVAAACILPSTSNLESGAHRLGTRHRAALGITEQTDAIALVISEETGIISVASNGHLVRRLDRRRLETFLASLLSPSRNSARGPQPAALES